MTHPSRLPIRPRRSALYMPGANPRALDKARGLDADVLILDLEDSVAPQAKEAARERVCAMVAARAWPGRETVIRVNAPRNRVVRHRFQRPLARAGPDAILIPKVDRSCTLFDIAIRLREADASPHVRIWAMIETPGAILRIAEITACAEDPATRLDCLVMGLNDLAKEDPRALHAGTREHAVLAADHADRRAHIRARYSRRQSATPSAMPRLLKPNAGRAAISASTARA